MRTGVASRRPAEALNVGDSAPCCLPGFPTARAPRMRSEQERESRGVRGSRQGARAGGAPPSPRSPDGQSFLSRLGFIFNQVKDGSFCFGAPTASLPKGPIFSQIRSLGRAGGAAGVAVPVELKGGPVTQTWLSPASSFFPGAWLLPTPLDPEPILCIACLHLACGVPASPHHHGNRNLCVHPGAHL